VHAAARTVYAAARTVHAAARTVHAAARTVYAAARTENRKNQLNVKYAIFAHESQSASKLTAGFSNFCCKLKQTFNLDIKLN